MRSLADIDVVVLTYKRDDLLKDCLDSLRRACGDEPRAIVVDNAPSPSTRELVAGYANALYLESFGNPGFAGGNNRAMPHCTRPYTLLLNNDTVIHSRASIEGLAAFLDEHPECGAAQGSMVLARAGGKLGGTGTFLTPFGFLYSPGFNVPDAEEFHHPFPVFSTIGAFMIFRRSILPAVGGFLFHDHFKSYYEETDFCHRVWLSGSEVWFVPTVPIDHLCGATMSMFPRREMMRQFIRNSWFSLRTCLGPWSRFRLLSCYAFVMAGHAAIHLLRGDWRTARDDLGLYGPFLSDRAAVRETRPLLAPFRKRSDRDLFRRVVKVPPLRYFLRSVRANG